MVSFDENKNCAGIYKIVNLLNGKFYIGSTISFRIRWAKHKSELQKNNHHCRHLQSSWNKYGGINFQFQIIEITKIEDRIKKEQEYLDRLFGNSCLFNSHNRANKHARDTRTKETLKKIYGRKKSQVEREKISQSRLGIRILQDRGFCEETKLILSLLIQGFKLPTKLNGDKKLIAKELLISYKTWTRSTKNPSLKFKQNLEKLQIKKWLQDQNLWYDGRADSWKRKSDIHKKEALENLAKYRNVKE